MKASILFIAMLFLGGIARAEDNNQPKYPPGWKECAKKLAKGPAGLSEKEMAECKDIALKSGIVYPRGEDEQPPKYPEGWKECKEKMETRGSAEWTEKERNECQKKVFEAIKIQKFTPGYQEPTPPRTYTKISGEQSAYPAGWAECEEKVTKPGHTEEEKAKCRKWIAETVEYHNGAPKPPLTTDLAAEITRDLEAQKVILKKALDDSIRPRPAKEKYEGQYVTLDFLGTFENEDKLQEYLEKETASSRKIPLRSVTRVKVGETEEFQFLDENGKVLRRDKTYHKASETERENLKNLLATSQRLKTLNEKPRFPGKKPFWYWVPSAMPTKVFKFWHARNGFLTELVRFYSSGEGPESMADYPDYQRVNVYDQSGKFLTTLEGEESVHVSPNGQYIVGLEDDERDTNRGRISFYNMKGELVRVLFPEGGGKFYDPVFSPNGKYVSPKIIGGLLHSGPMFLFDDKGNTVWKKERGASGYSNALFITDNGEMMAGDRWIDRNGLVVWEAEAKMSLDTWIKKDFILDMDKKLMLVTEVQHGLNNSVSDLNTGKVLENIPDNFFPTRKSEKCVNNQYLKHMGYKASDGGYTPLIYLYRVKLKK